MQTKDQQLCEAILSSGEEVAKMSLVTVMRNGALLLALPLNRQHAKKILALYQPQKLKGRLLLKMLQLFVFTGLYHLLPRYEVSVGDRGLMASLGLQGDEHQFGFLLGNAESVHRNMIGLYVRDGEPCVIKAGCGASVEGILNEDSLMTKFADLVEGVPRSYGTVEFEGGGGYVAERVIGRSPRKIEDQLVFDILVKWLDVSQVNKVSDLSCWKSLMGKLADTEKEQFAPLHNMSVLAPVMHGDFAPWNIKINKGNEMKVLDWEAATSFGMPSWDWFHYHIQRMRLVHSMEGSEIVRNCQELLRAKPMQVYFEQAGLRGVEYLVFGAYLFYSGRVQGYQREDLIESWETSFKEVASGLTR